MAFGDATGIVQVQEAIRRLHCPDPRDKIFAIINLFGSSCTITPDYEISCFDLALEVLGEYAACANDRRCIELAAYLCHNLHLEPASVDFDVALTRNRSFLTTSRDEGQYVLPRRITGPSKLQQTTAWACQVFPDKFGQMTAPFITHGLVNSPTPMDSNPIVANHQPAAIATCSFETGDWIAPLSHYVSDYYRSYCVGLVFRLRAGVVYDIVGEVAFFPSCRPCVSWETCDCQLGHQFHTHYATSFEIAFDCEELLLFSTRIQEPYGKMRQESQSIGRGEPHLPAGPPMSWKSTRAMRHDSTKPVVTRIS